MLIIVFNSRYLLGTFSVTGSSNTVACLFATKGLTVKREKSASILNNRMMCAMILVSNIKLDTPPMYFTTFLFFFVFPSNDELSLAGRYLAVSQ